MNFMSIKAAKKLVNHHIEIVVHLYLLYCSIVVDRSDIDLCCQANLHLTPILYNCAKLVFFVLFDMLLSKIMRPCMDKHVIK